MCSVGRLDCALQRSGTAAPNHTKPTLLRWLCWGHMQQICSSNKVYGMVSGFFTSGSFTNNVSSGNPRRKEADKKGIEAVQEAIVSIVVHKIS